AIHRALIPADRLPRLARPATVRIWLGPGRHCVCYPIQGGRWLNAVFTGDPFSGYTSWTSDVRDLVSTVDTTLCFVPQDRAPLDRWCTDRVALIGDAAHAMLPFGAQGANQAIEDAVALAA